jgi:ribosome-associated protein
MLVVTEEIKIPLREMKFSYARSSGPGGQSVNKVNSKALLRWNPGQSIGLPFAVRMRFFSRFSDRLTVDGEILITSDRHRDQRQNQNDCLEKLKVMIESVAYAPKVRKKTKPSFSSRVKRLSTKQKHGAKKTTRKRNFDHD